MLTKALILARGLGTRMREADGQAGLRPSQARAADAGLKAMMPVQEAGTGTPAAGRPFLDYVLATLADAGYCDIGIVIAPGESPIRRRYTTDEVPTRLQIAWILQPQPLGTADAVSAAETWAAADEFVVLNGDNLYPTDVLRAMRDLDGPGLPVFLRDDLVRSGIPADRLASFALVRIDERGFLTEIVEKPGAAAMSTAGPDALISMNCWRFDRRIFDACRAVPLSSRGERELPMAVGLAAAAGVRFRAMPARGEVIDLSRRADVARVSRALAGRSPRL